MKAERSVDGTHDNIITVSTANGGMLLIGTLQVFHNVTGGANANAFIQETGGTSLRFRVDHAYIDEAGAQVRAHPR